MNLMKELTELLETERNLFESLRKEIENQKNAMLVKDIDAMNESLLNVERLSLKIEEVDRKRHEIFLKLKRKYGLREDAYLTDLLSKIDENEREEFVNGVSRFLSTLNDLAAELDGLKEMMEFENKYYEFLMNLLGGEIGGVYGRDGTYGKASRNAPSALNTRW
jgi:hypothetical protein